MMNRVHSLLAVLALATSVSSPRLGAQQASPVDADQRVLAQQLGGPSAQERSSALTESMRLTPDDIGPDLRAALIALLERENRARSARDAAYRAGLPMPPLENGGEFIGGVVKLVAGLEDPRAIPALAGSLGTGFQAINALVAFGEPAVAPVIAVAGSPESRTSQVNDALGALTLFVRNRSTRPLSGTALGDIERVAELRLLETRKSITTAWTAIDLATALPNPRLWLVVERIAADPAEAIARGASDPGLIQQTQKRAADALTRARATRPPP